MRRALDIVVSVAALLVLSPLFLLIAAAILWDSPGGVFYPAWRAGKDGRPFRMWKFRTMRVGSAQSGAITGREDPRVTRVGRTLRRTKWDELPQFWNVLAGEMTLVGPRPEAPEIASLYSPDQRPVLAVKPGITGCAQLEGASEADGIPAGAGAEEYYVRNLLPGKVRRDLEYLKTKTAWSDARIVWRTTLYVFRSLRSRRDQPTG